MTDASPAVSFQQTVATALKHFQDPGWLGTHSPLAAPYLLARHLKSSGDVATAAPVVRGRELQKLLSQAATQVGGKNAGRSRQILEEYYFKDRPVDIVCNMIHVSRATFHTSRSAAIDALAEVLTKLLSPAMMLEVPPGRNALFVGRSEYLALGRAALERRATVLVSGATGMGKTALGSQVAHSDGSLCVCWFTLRPGLNDTLGTLLMYLGHFFDAHGAPALWMQMIATQGATELGVIPGLVRSIVMAPGAPRYVLCLDDAHLLQPGVGEPQDPQRDEEHSRLRAFLQSVRGALPILLMGQGSALEADAHVALDPLSPVEVAAWLAAASIDLSARDQATLYAQTQGVPHLVELSLALRDAGEPLASPAAEGVAPSLEALLGRMLARLDATAHAVLLEVAVVPGVAPADGWHEGARSRALAQLVAHHLVQQDEHGGVWVPAPYRAAIVGRLSADQLAALHAQAGQHFARRGQYTAAAFHYARSSRPEEAVLLWREVTEQEIDQGQAHSARQIFRDLPTAALSEPLQEQLRLVLARLEHLVGHPRAAQAYLDAQPWPVPVLAVEASELGGVVANDLSDYQEARQTLQAGLDRAEQLLEVRLARMRKGKGWAHLMEKQLDLAWREARLAEYEVENLKGYIQEEYSDYQQAEAHYMAALTLAEELGHNQGIAKTGANLSGLYARRGRFDEAYALWARALDGYQRIGKPLSVAGCMINRSFIANLAGDHAGALATAEEVAGYLAARGIEATPRLQAIICQATAEAALGLGDLVTAQAQAEAAIASGNPAILADAQRTLAEVHLRAGRSGEARRLVVSAISQARETEDLYLEAYAWRVAGQIHRACGEEGEAAKATVRAREIFGALNLPNEVASTE